MWAGVSMNQQEQEEEEPAGSRPAPRRTSYRPAWKPLLLGLVLGATGLLILAGTRSQVEALNCYHCSSVDNPECDESFTGRANITDTDCEKVIGRPAKVCRKLVQYIEHKKVVIRSCGYIDESLDNSNSNNQNHKDHNQDKKPACLKRSGTFAIMMESCNCYTDNCNYSASLVPTQSVLFPLTVLLVFFTLLLHQSQLIKPTAAATIITTRSHFIDSTNSNNS